MSLCSSAKQKAAHNSTLWNQWLRNVEQSTIWNYYVSRLAGGSCTAKDRGCYLATRCLALGPGGGPNGEDVSGSVDADHPHGCGALFTDDHLYPKPALAHSKRPRGANPQRFEAPLPRGQETPAAPGPSPLARWVDKALTNPCDKHSHKVCQYFFVI